MASNQIYPDSCLFFCGNLYFWSTPTIPPKNAFAKNFYFLWVCLSDSLDIVMSRWRKRYIVLTRLYWGPRGAKKKAVHARYPADAIIGPCQPCLRLPLPKPLQLARSPIQDRPDWSQTLIQVPRTCACPKMLTCLIILCGPAPNIGRDIWVAMWCRVWETNWSRIF